MNHEQRIEVLGRQGVEILAPASVEIGDEVKLEQIRGPGTVLHAGTKLCGERLLILPGTRIGFEEPATVRNCAIGSGCTLGGGYFDNAVFLDGAQMAKGAHVRGGTLLEEQASGAHTVGLKQTLLLPFVTLGSLINFCDVLMAGGSSRRDHSEVGSSFIHFNFTPFGRHGDKATPSLVGDVPRGVMLRSSRIFLGGQGGLVGPLHIDYGTVLAAGFVYRRDHGPHELVIGEKLVTRSIPFTPLRYSRIWDKVRRNLVYIGNLIALWHWYEEVRLAFFADEAHVALYRMGQANVASCIEERIKRLGQVAGYMEDSIRELERDGAVTQKELHDQRALLQHWPELESQLWQYRTLTTETNALELLRQGLSRCSGKTYLDAIAALDEDAVAAGTRWLDGLVASVMKLAPTA